MRTSISISHLQNRKKRTAKSGGQDMGSGLQQTFYKGYDELPAKSDQRDHAVSQYALEDLALTIEYLLSGEIKVQDTNIHLALKILAKQIRELGLNPNLSDILCEIPQNLTPGYALSATNPGDMFDIGVEKMPNPAIIAHAPSTALLMDIDNLSRKLGRLATWEAEDNEQRDRFLLETINSLTIDFGQLESLPIPKFDRSLWYLYKRKAVKKASAEYLEGIPPNFDKWEIQQGAPDFAWMLKVPGIAPVQVNVEIPPEAWMHIYQRHTMGQFAGDVQAVNTFWKMDPAVHINKKLLKPEINLLLDRTFNFYNVQDGQIEIYNNVADKLFIQASAIYQETGRCVEVTIQSIAPQSPEIAWAILPEHLSVAEQTSSEQERAKQAFQKKGYLFNEVSTDNNNSLIRALMFHAKMEMIESKVIEIRDHLVFAGLVGENDLLILKPQDTKSSKIVKSILTDLGLSEKANVCLNFGKKDIYIYKPVEFGALFRLYSGKLGCYMAITQQ